MVHISAKQFLFSISGCDQTGKFYGHSKLSCWKTFVSSPTPVALSQLSETITKPTESDVQFLEQFVMQLYCKKIPSIVGDLTDFKVAHVF